MTVFKWPVPAKSIWSMASWIVFFKSLGKLAWSSFSRTWMMVVLVHSLDACNLAHKDVASVCTNLLSGWLCASFPNGLAPGQNLQLSKVESSLALRSIGKLGLLAGA